MKSIGKYLGLLLSWPLVALIARLLGKNPAPGQRWADVNPGAGTFLAVTLLFWLLALLLIAIWMVTFRVVVPFVEKKRRNTTTNEPR